MIVCKIVSMFVCMYNIVSYCFLYVYKYAVVCILLWLALAMYVCSFV